MIPIEKNIIVTDVDGRRIGTTYPKRAKGLLKNGRAEYVNDREIRLTNTHASAVYTTEDETMSKVINFNTRDFVFDATCKVNRGFRGFVTTPNGNEEIWEIGDWNWNWTQIITKYEVPYSQTVPEEYKETMNNPVFAVDEFSRDVLLKRIENHKESNDEKYLVTLSIETGEFIMECHYYGANMYDFFPAFGMNPIPDKIPPTGNN